MCFYFREKNADSYPAIYVLVLKGGHQASYTCVQIQIQLIVRYWSHRIKPTKTRIYKIQTWKIDSKLLIIISMIDWAEENFVMALGYL